VPPKSNKTALIVKDHSLLLCCFLWLGIAAFMAFGRRRQSRSLSFSKQGTATNFGNYKKQKLTSQSLTQNTSNPNNSYSSLFSGKEWSRARP
jgi:hypothetical protein